MRKIIGIGETVLDIIFRDDRPVSAVPGGSVYNSVISLGRAGANVAFFGEVGDDRIGRRTIEYLRENGVDASGVNMFKDTKSPLSLAFLNEKNDAEYAEAMQDFDFYKAAVEIIIENLKNFC